MPVKKIIFIFFLLILGNKICSQDKFVDSLKLALRNAKHDTVKINILFLLVENVSDDNIWIKYNDTAAKLSQQLSENKNELVKIRGKKGIAESLNNYGFSYGNKGEVTQALDYYLNSLKLYEEIPYKPGIAMTLNNIGFACRGLGDNNKALDYYLRSCKMYETIGDKKSLAYLLNNVGHVYDKQGKQKLALDYYSKSLKIQEEIGNKAGVATLLNNIGFIYDNQGDTAAALVNYNKSLKLRQELGAKKDVASSLGTIGLLYANNGNTKKGLEFLEKSFKILEELQDTKGIADAYNNLASIWNNIGQTEKAYDYFFKSLKIRRQIVDKAGIITSYLNLGRVFLKQKKYKEASAYCDSSLNLAKELNYLYYMPLIEYTYVKIDSCTKNYLGAFEHYKQYIIVKDSFNSEGNRKAVIRDQLKYEFEKKSIADSVRVQEEKKVINAKLDQEKTKSYALYGGLALVLIFSVFMVNRFMITNKQKKIIEKKEKETSIQKEIIEEKQKEIMDSINYAKRIQYTLLANDKLLDENLKEHFVYFKPKDVVSGDFYWATKKDNLFYIAACDSTGHGVPGAFMSLLNISFLNEAVIEKNILAPNEILNHVRKRLIESMDGGQDGMDAILVCFDTKNKTISYSAANNEPICIKNNNVIELKKDKMPVGKGDKKESFTAHPIEYNNGDSLFIYTDGYADQFGGPKGKKFKYKELNELLLKNSALPFSQQAQLLDKAFIDWKGEMEQVDDVCIIGIKL